MWRPRKPERFPIFNGRHGVGRYSANRKYDFYTGLLRGSRSADAAL